MQNNLAFPSAGDAPERTVVSDDVRQEILRAVAGIEYGSVEIVVHGAKVIQIEVRQKRRFGTETKALR